MHCLVQIRRTTARHRGGAVQSGAAQRRLRGKKETGWLTDADASSSSTGAGIGASETEAIHKLDSPIGIEADTREAS
jgi:hypothetical protein